MNADSAEDALPRHFQSTLWTAVIAPAKDSTSKEGAAALETLCRMYWGPIYWLVRRKHSREEAQDLTQSFFAHLLQHNGVAKASREKGRFRAFLRASLNNFLVSEWRARSPSERNGFHITSLELEQAEGQFEAQAAESETPEAIFDKRWAIALIDRAIKRLRQEYNSNKLFADLEPLLTEKGSSYAEIAKRHNMSVGAVGVAIHRLREKFAEFLRYEVAQTVAPENVDDELRYLIAVWGT